MNTIYLSDNQIVMNYNRMYPKNRDTLLKSDTFRFVLEYFMDEIQNPTILKYLTIDNSINIHQASKDMSHFLRQLDEIDHPYARDPDMLLTCIEEMYKFWRNRSRFAFMKSQNMESFGVNTLVGMDSNVNSLILRTYRLFEEKVQGRSNSVYRNAQAGTNACFSIYQRDKKFSKGYEALQEIPMIDTVMLRTPMILHPKSSKVLLIRFIKIRWNISREVKITGSVILVKLVLYCVLHILISNICHWHCPWQIYLN